MKLWSEIKVKVLSWFGSRFLPSGGTTGQTLIKQSSTDFDAAWEDLPTEIVWVADEASRPLTGDATKAYVSKATGMIYRWDGALMTYMLIGGGAGTPYLTFTGTDTYISTNSPAITAYPKALYGIFVNANTGSSTVKIDSLPALPVKLNGGALIANNILAGAVKILLLAEDSSHYQLQAGTFDLPTVASGEKVLTLKTNGLQANIDVIDSRSATLTTVAQLSNMDWSTGSVSATGIIGETRVGNGYKYFCEGTNLWFRIPIELNIMNFIRGSINDTGSIKSSIEMTSLFPAAVAPQIVFGTLGMYMYVGNNVWFYFESKN